MSDIDTQKSKEGNLPPPLVGGQEADPSASSHPVSSQRRVKRKRDDKEPPQGLGSPSRTLQSGFLPHDSSSRKSQRTMPMDSSSHVGYYSPGDGYLRQMDGTMRTHDQPYLFRSVPPVSSSAISTSYSSDLIGTHIGTNFHLHPLLQSISGEGSQGPGKLVKRDQEMQEVPWRKSSDTVLMGKMPDQQPQQPGGLPFAQFGGGVITPPQHVIQMSEMSRERSSHHSRGGGGSAFQATIDSSGNGHPREHRKRPGPELQLESSKRSPPSDERNIRPPPASLRLPSKGAPTAVHQFMSPFMESDEAKDSKLKEQFPPGFDYDPNLPMNLKYQLLAYQNEQKRQEKARMDKPSSKHSVHHSPSSSSQQQQQLQQHHHHHGEPQRQRSNEHLPVPSHMISASPHRSSSSRQTPPPAPRVPTPTAGIMSSTSHGRTPSSHHPAGGSSNSSGSGGGGSSSGSRSFPSQHHNGGSGEAGSHHLFSHHSPSLRSTAQELSLSSNEGGELHILPVIILL